MPSRSPGQAAPARSYGDHRRETAWRGSRSTPAATSLSVHEVGIDPNPGRKLVYVSYYSGGFRILRYGDTGLTEVGAFIDQWAVIGSDWIICWSAVDRDPREVDRGGLQPARRRAVTSAGVVYESAIWVDDWNGDGHRLILRNGEVTKERSSDGRTWKCGRSSVRA
jgi:hypothetical protein